MAKQMKGEGLSPDGAPNQRMEAAEVDSKETVHGAGNWFLHDQGSSEWGFRPQTVRFKARPTYVIRGFG